MQRDGEYGIELEAGHGGRERRGHGGREAADSTVLECVDDATGRAGHISGRADEVDGFKGETARAVQWARVAVESGAVPP